jgi:hypothetical protein
MEAPSIDHPEAIAAAMGALDRHLTALNSGDAVALAPTLHFPHYRLAGGGPKIWERPETYLQDFYARAGNEWHQNRRVAAFVQRLRELGSIDGRTVAIKVSMRGGRKRVRSRYRRRVPLTSLFPGQP